MRFNMLLSYGTIAIAIGLLFAACDSTGKNDDLVVDCSRMKELITIKSEFDNLHSTSLSGNTASMLFKAKTKIDYYDGMITIATLNEEENLYVNYFLQVNEIPYKGLPLEPFDAEILFIHNALVVND